jgi:hypothetical protein
MCHHTLAVTLSASMLSGSLKRRMKRPILRSTRVYPRLRVRTAYTADRLVLFHMVQQHEQDGQTLRLVRRCRCCWCCCCTAAYIEGRDCISRSSRASRLQAQPSRSAMPTAEATALHTECCIAAAFSVQPITQPQVWKAVKLLRPTHWWLGYRRSCVNVTHRQRGGEWHHQRSRRRWP